MGKKKPQIEMTIADLAKIVIDSFDVNQKEFDKINERFDGIENRITQLEIGLKNLRYELKTFRSENAFEHLEIKSEIARLQKRIDAKPETFGKGAVIDNEEFLDLMARIKKLEKRLTGNRAA
ncbi:MAG: hypothetical protein NTW79_03835 [Candidatus Berkelbacteria bacterium]|nr:hypothetical protein [Candidatus Berkelbacteria bacterium]